MGGTSYKSLCFTYILRPTYTQFHDNVVFGPSLRRSLAPPTFVAGRDRPGGGAPRHFRPATLAPRLSSQFTVSLRLVYSQFRVRVVINN